MMKDGSIIIICGPTASGKSDLALQLAKHIDGEIVSADSTSIYRELDIGSAKPTKIEQNEVVHHMVDICSPFDNYSVSDYQTASRKAIDDIISRNKQPIICGGTGFYIKSILYDFSYGGCPKNEEVRQKYEDILKSKGKEYLFELLEKVDFETSKKLHINDTLRVIRALEIFESTGRKKSDIIDEPISKYKYHIYSYKFNRQLLYNRINYRVDKMFDLGLQKEVLSLKEKGLNPENNQSMRAIGYKEFFEENFNSLDTIKEKIKLNTRHYAKRQITFFNSFDNLQYLEFLEPSISVKQILENINNEIK